jgi:NAD+ synthase (glutamine-hydrolysing)
VPSLRLALAQVNATVGDLEGNASLVLRWAEHAQQRGAHLAVFPEGVITGYPAEDLVLRESFVAASIDTVVRLAQQLAAAGLGELPVVLGYVDSAPRGRPFNAAAVLHRGGVVTTYAKHHLPNYGVFDEARYFTPGERFPVVRVRGIDVALTICEDLWQDGGPIAAARTAGVGLVLTINGSPYERDKDDFRLALAQRRAAEAGATLAYVNLVGGQDELVFDGDSLVVAPDGTLLARAPQFEEGLLVADLELPAASDDRWGAVPVGDGGQMVVERVTVSAEPLPEWALLPSGIAARLDDTAEVWRALVLGTRDYVRKNGFSSVVLGLSGGIDSAVVAVLAADALGPSAVHAVGMPSRHSSPGSLTDAEELTHRVGVNWEVIPIDPVVRGFEGAVELHGLAAENLQARVRGTLLMALSNERGHLVLATGNKSELATGYSTLYGDAVGGYAPIKDVPKTDVWALARWRNAWASERGETPPIPEASISKPPSAELRPGQQDSDSLPPYEALDAVLDDYVERDLGRAALLRAGHDEGLVDRVMRLVDHAEYKRRQYPPGPKVSSRNFGRDRRLPITSRWREGPAADPAQG